MIVWGLRPVPQEEDSSVGCVITRNHGQEKERTKGGGGRRGDGKEGREGYIYFVVEYDIYGVNTLKNNRSEDTCFSPLGLLSLLECPWHSFHRRMYVYVQ